MTTLHYIHDPLCGWCYAAAPLIKVAREVLVVQPHAGGMMTGARRQLVTPQLRNFVIPHDQRIAKLTGQPFGEAYFEVLLRDAQAVLDSEPPTTAMLAAQQVAQRGLDMLARVQTAHYVEGRRIADRNVLVELATDLGIEREAFEQAFTQLSGAATQQHIAETRGLLSAVGGAGFPTLVFEINEGMTVLDIGPFLGKPEQWREWLLRYTNEARSNSPAVQFCDIDGNC